MTQTQEPNGPDEEGTVPPMPREDDTQEFPQRDEEETEETEPSGEDDASQ